MKRIYSHPNIAMVHLAKNELENRGIEAVIQGEHATAVVGGGAGIEAWNELWIIDERRAQEAVGVIERVIEASTDEEGKPWTCPTCGEKIDSPFEVCWNCGAERPEKAA